MEHTELLRRLAKVLTALDFEGVKTYTEQALQAAIPPKTIITDGLSAGMEAVGNKFAFTRAT